MALSHKAVVEKLESCGRKQTGPSIKVWWGSQCTKKHVHKAWTHTVMIVLDKNVKWQCGVHGL